jgi:hypothetical protein
MIHVIHSIDKRDNSSTLFPYYFETNIDAHNFLIELGYSNVGYWYEMEDSNAEIEELIKKI